MDECKPLISGNELTFFGLELADLPQAALDAQVAAGAFTRQPEPFLAQSTPSTPPDTPCHPLNIPYTTSKRTPYPTESAYIEPTSGRV